MLLRTTLVLVAVVGSFACAPPDGSLTVNGTSKKLNLVQGDVTGNGGGHEVLRISVLTAPSWPASTPQTQDGDLTDNLNVDVALAIDQFPSLPSQDSVAIDGDRIVGSFTYHCELCDKPAQAGAPTAVDGALFIKDHDEGAHLDGTLDVTLTGADTNGLDVGTVVIHVPFTAAAAL